VHLAAEAPAGEGVATFMDELDADEDGPQPKPVAWNVAVFPSAPTVTVVDDTSLSPFLRRNSTVLSSTALTDKLS
jgi:hypothetical protein